MEAELKRLVMRSPFDIRAPETEAGGGGDAPLSVRRPHRLGRGVPSPHLVTDFVGPVLPARRCGSSPSSRSSCRRCARTSPAGGRVLRFSVDLGSAQDFEASPLQLRGVVKNAIVEALASRGVTAEVDADSPDVVFVVRRAGTPESRRTVVGIDIGARRAPSPRRAGRRRSRAAARDDGGAARDAVAVGCAVRAAGRSDGRRRRRSRSKPRAWRSAPPSGGRRICRSVTWPRSPGCRGSAGPLSRNRPAHPRARHRRRADSRDGRQPSRGRPDRAVARGLNRHRADGCPHADAGRRRRACFRAPPT